MKKQLSDLYQNVILKHNKAPYNFKKAEDQPHTIEAYNPLCGDHFHVYFTIEGGKVKQAFFHGYGCAVSKASTSVLLQRIEGKTLEEIIPLIARFMQIVHGEMSDASQEDLMAFAAAKDFPGREQCATLSWSALREFAENEF